MSQGPSELEAARAGDASGDGSPYAHVAAIVARIPLAPAGREMVDGFRSQITALDRLSDSSQAEIVEGVERNLRRWQRWLDSGVAPRAPTRGYASRTCCGPLASAVRWDGS